MEELKAADVLGGNSLTDTYIIIEEEKGILFINGQYLFTLTEVKSVVEKYDIKNHNIVKQIEEALETNHVEL